MQIEEIIKILTADFPAPIWYVPSCVLFLLAIASFVDARTGRVPDSVIGIGLLGALASLAWYADWFVAGERFLYVAASILVLRLANAAYHKMFQHDAFGFGDAKWTGLAVAGFSYEPVIGAWIIGAWCAIIWLGVRWLWRRVSDNYYGHSYVHFAPFLFIGLVATLFRKPLIDAITVLLA
jgi:prepilin signal peptidase PulO-like enzyme (type II secretory pathway)